MIPWRWILGVVALVAVVALAAVVVLEKATGKNITFFPDDDSSEVAPPNLPDALPETLFPQLRARGYVCDRPTSEPIPVLSCETRDGGREIGVRRGLLIGAGVPTDAWASLARPSSAADLARWARDAVLTLPEDERGDLERWLREHHETNGETATHSAEIALRVARDGIRADISARGKIIELPSGQNYGRWPGARAARELAPTLVFDAAEQFFPVSVDGYLANTELCTFTVQHRRIRYRRGRPKFGDRVRSTGCNPAPSLGELPPKDRGPECPDYDHDLCYWALDIPRASETDRGDIVSYEEAQARMLEHDKGRHTVYWNYVDDPRPNRSVLQYWFLYPFNSFGNTHEGDWEAIVLQTEAFVGYLVPVRAAYSSHDGGRSTKLADRRPDGRRLGSIVYVAAGSHANYLEPGRATVTVCDDRRIVCVESPEHACGDGKTLRPGEYDLKPLPATPAFWGSYGGANFVAGIARVPDPRPIRDPRIRIDWSDDPVAMFRRAATDAQDVKRC